MPDLPTIRLLTSLRRYFTDQHEENGDNDQYYLGAAVALETALKLLAGPQYPKPARSTQKARPAPTKAEPVTQRRKPRRGGYSCPGCDKVYGVRQSLNSHLTHHPDHRVT